MGKSAKSTYADCETGNLAARGSETRHRVRGGVREEKETKGMLAPQGGVE